MSDSKIVHTKKSKVKLVKLKDLSKTARIKYRTQAFKLFEKGFGYRVVATQLRISVYTARDWARLYRAGEFEPKIKHPGKSPENLTTKEIRNQVKTEYEMGATISGLSLKYGKNKGTVRYWVKNRGELSLSCGL